MRAKVLEMMNLPIIDKITRMKYIPNEKAEGELAGILAEIDALHADDIVDRISGRMMTDLKKD